MLRTEPIDGDPDRWSLACGRCGWTHDHSLSGAAALELDGTDCFACEVDPAELEQLRDEARLILDAYADTN
jgi:hypothetical protein